MINRILHFFFVLDRPPMNDTGARGGMPDVPSLLPTPAPAAVEEDIIIEYDKVDQENEAIKSLKERLEKSEQILLIIISRILRISTSEDLESLSRLRPEELISKFEEEVMAKVA